MVVAGTCILGSRFSTFMISLKVWSKSNYIYLSTEHVESHRYKCFINCFGFQKIMAVVWICQNVGILSRDNFCLKHNEIMKQSAVRLVSLIYIIESLTWVKVLVVLEIFQITYNA